MLLNSQNSPSFGDTCTNYYHSAIALSHHSRNHSYTSKAKVLFFSNFCPGTYELIYSQTVIAITSIKQQSVFKGPYFVNSNVHVQQGLESHGSFSALMS